MNDDTSSPSFSELLIEGIKTKNIQEFQKVANATANSESSLVMFKLLQTLCNFHDAVADIYAQKGDKGQATYHYQLANRIRTEAQHNKNAFGQ